MILAALIICGGISDRADDVREGRGSTNQERRPIVCGTSQLIEEIGAQRKRLASARASYDVYAVENGASTRKYRTTVVARGQDRYSETVHFVDQIPPELDPLSNRCSLTANELRVFYPILGLCRVSAELTKSWGSSKLSCPLFVEYTGWWPPDDQTLPPLVEEKFLIHDALASGEYLLRPYLEQVQGAWCHVLEWPGRDLLFVERREDATPLIRRRERSFGKPSSRFSIYELSDYRDTQGVMIPYRFGARNYATLSLGEEPSRILKGEILCIMDDFRPNPPDDDEIAFALPPGTMVKNVDTNEVTQIPGGVSFIDQSIAISLSRAEIFGRVSGANIPMRRASRLLPELSSATPSIATFCVTLAIGLLAPRLVKFKARSAQKAGLLGTSD